MLITTKVAECPALAVGGVPKVEGYIHYLVLRRKKLII